MNILLLFPKSTFMSAPLVWPPLGLWYLAAQLEAQGHHVDFQDMSADDQLPEDGRYDQLWISAKSPQMYEIRKIAKHVEGWWRTRTVLGGAAAWVAPHKYVDWFNLIVSGEGDHPDTIQQIVSRAYLTHGIYYPELYPDLSWVKPPVRRWSLNYHAYMTDQEGHTYRMTSLFTTRGCPMNCDFCESGRMGIIWGDRTRYEPLRVVERQIVDSLDLGFTGIAYYDDVFILNRKRTQEMLALHHKYGKLPWRCFLRSDILCKHGGRDYLKEMKDSGLIEIFVGVESASNEIKSNIHKGTTIEQDEAVLNWCKELGITCKMSFILGLPGESLETLQATRDWILKHRPHIAQVDRLIPFPGTPLFDHPEAYDLHYETIPDEEWFFRGKYDLSTPSFVSTSHLTRDQIDKFWHETEQIIKEEGLSTYVR